jgi:hypothetical protein
MAGLIHRWLHRQHHRPPVAAFTDTEHRWIMDAAMERARESIAMATTHDHLIVARAKADRITADAAMFIAAGTQRRYLQMSAQANREAAILIRLQEARAA